MNRVMWQVAPVILAGLVRVAPAAECQLGAPFSENMVLQRDRQVPVWGWADEGTMVTVAFAGQKKTAVAGKDANPYSTAAARNRSWMVKLDALKMSTTPAAMTITAGGTTRTLDNILVGDVWICSGQSNMGRNVSRSILPEGMSMEHPLIRYIGGGQPAAFPQDHYPEPRQWQVCSGEENVMGCVAVGFFFARRIQQDVQVPIGLLWPAWAGTIIRQWIPPDGFRSEPELRPLAERVDSWYPDTEFGRAVWKEKLREYEKWLEEAEAALREDKPFPYPQPRMPEPGQRDATTFYNGLTHPLVPYAAKGILWYQGESDYRTSDWHILMRALCSSWRKRFGEGQMLPVYFMQIQRSGDYCSPLIRDRQFKSLQIPSTGMAVLLDLDVNVHPANKVDSGERLALWALARDYGKKDLVYSGPLYKESRADGGKMVIVFDHAETGLMIGRKEGLKPAQETPGGTLKNIFIAGADKKFKPARSRVEGQTLVVWSDEVPEPVAVRYCYDNIPPEPFLYNKAGLPAAQFRTDEW